MKKGIPFEPITLYFGLNAKNADIKARGVTAPFALGVIIGTGESLLSSMRYVSAPVIIALEANR